MTVSIPNHTAVLGALASGRLLADVIRDKKAIRLYADDFRPDDALSGIVVGGDEHRIIVETAPLSRRTRAMFSARDLRARIDVCGCRYSFATRCVDMSADLAADRLRIVRPTVIEVVERRRSARRQLRAPADALIRPTGGGEDWSLCADVLNVSADGIACRMDAEPAARLQVGRQIGVTLRLDTASEGFALTALVISVIEASTPARVIVGMEFVKDGRWRASCARLRAALEPRPSV